MSQQPTDSQDAKMFEAAALVSLSNKHFSTPELRAKEAYDTAQELCRLHDDGCPHAEDDDAEDDAEDKENAAYEAGLDDGKDQGRRELLAEQAAENAIPAKKS